VVAVRGGALRLPGEYLEAHVEVGYSGKNGTVHDEIFCASHAHFLPWKLKKVPGATNPMVQSIKHTDISDFNHIKSSFYIIKIIGVQQY
jgi:hypothetical protein